MNILRLDGPATEQVKLHEVGATEGQPAADRVQGRLPTRTLVKPVERGGLPVGGATLGTEATPRQLRFAVSRVGLMRGAGTNTKCSGPGALGGSRTWRTTWLLPPGGMTTA